MENPVLVFEPPLPSDESNGVEQPTVDPSESVESVESLIKPAEIVLTAENVVSQISKDFDDSENEEVPELDDNVGSVTVEKIDTVDESVTIKTDTEPVVEVENVKVEETIVEAENTEIETIIELDSTEVETIVEAENNVVETIVEAESNEVETIVEAENNEVETIIEVEPNKVEETVVENICEVLDNTVEEIHNYLIENPEDKTPELIVPTDNDDKEVITEIFMGEEIIAETDAVETSKADDGIIIIEEVSLEISDKMTAELEQIHEVVTPPEDSIEQSLIDMSGADPSPMEVEAINSDTLEMNNEVVAETDMESKEVEAIKSEGVNPESMETSPIVSESSTRRTKNNKQKDNDEVNIPCHVMGRNVDNPTEDMVSNGRTPPKPRLGVKVPYRNLTSQIVTKQDIANELLERAAKRNPNPDPPLGGDIFFCKKLTSNLASKLAMKTEKVVKLTDKNPEQNILSAILPDEGMLTPTLSTEVATKPTSITDNSDLLAILEGNIDVDWTTDIGQKPADKVNDLSELSPPSLTPVESLTLNTKLINSPPKLESPATPVASSQSKKVLDPEIEKQMALKQLKELPKKTPRKSRNSFNTLKQQTTEKVPEKQGKVEDVKTSPIAKALNKAAAKENSQPTKSTDAKKSEISDDLIVTNLSPKKVTKTYSRKDPIVEVPADLAKNVNESESDKPPEPVTPQTEGAKSESSTVEKPKNKSGIPIQKRPSNQEVTLTSKRARIIKKKVIWDPDETANIRQLGTKKTEYPEKTAVEKTVSPATPASVEKTKVNKSLASVKAKLMIQKKQLDKSKRIPIDVLKKVVDGKVKKMPPKVLKKKVIAQKVKKLKPKLTELDRLLMDEGAVNLLYTDKNNVKARKSVISIDKAQRELLNRIKAVKNVICNSSQEDTPKALRKKDSPIPTPVIPQRKKSRDSIRSSLQSPPPSPSYMYPHRAEASRIIRRHSSSFSSECSTPRRMSIDPTYVPDVKIETKSEDKKDTSVTPASQKKSLRKKGVPIFIRQREQNTYKGKVRQALDGKKEKITVADKQKLNVKMQKKFSDVKKITRSSKSNENGNIKSPVKTVIPKVVAVKTVKKAEQKVTVDTKSISYKEISLRKIDNLVQIILTPTSSKIKNAFNLQTFKELCDILNKLSKDDDCRVVLVTSTDSCFCHGVDFSVLIQSTAEKRNKAAQEMSNVIKEFLHSLVLFPKPLVAGVQGSAVGLGVTMLPLFDIVLASDKATFSTPYGRLGQVPEGATLLTLPHLMGNALTSELLFACRKLTASEALSHGLVTKILWPDKFQEELIPIAKSIASQSKQCLEATKALLRHSVHEKLKSTLDTEHKLLIQHWTSAECQQNFKKLLQENEWW